MNTILDKFASKTIRTPFGNVADIISNPGFIEAMRKAGSDEETARRVMANPKAYFDGEGVSLPPRTHVTVAKAEGSAHGKVHVTVPEQCYEVLWTFDICIGGEGEAEGSV